MAVAAGALEDRSTTYVEVLANALAHADREEPFSAYCRGLILPGERKSVEPMAARIRPERVSAAHQSLHHLVAKAAWSDEALLAAVREQVSPALGPLTAWIIDDTSFPKKGRHSVGVARQYCGELGKQDNCQVAVSLSVANEQASLPIAYRLYLPQAWADDPARRHKAGVPEEIAFQTKPQIALEQIQNALAQGVPPGVVLADAGYGADMAFQAELLDRGLDYVVGILPNTSVWRPGTGPLPPKPWSGRGRPPTRLRREAGHVPVAAEELARSLPAGTWQVVRWREGTKGGLASRFAALRVRPGHRDHDRSAPWPELWLLVEWPADEREPTRYWLAGQPACRPTRPWCGWSSWPSCAGGSSAITRNSSRSWAWGTSKGVAGAGSITMPACASRLTASSSWSGRGFPLAGRPAVDSRRLSYPRASGRGGLGLRRQRHVPHSIASLRHRLAVLLARQLDLCPCCERDQRQPADIS
jgi:SRSO17 transposase